MIPVQVTWTHATCLNVPMLETETYCNSQFIVPIIVTTIL
jgi:hypothetical protein